MIVMKFGGTSVKDAAALNRVASIVGSQIDNNPAVIVSAMGNTTDILADILTSLNNEEETKARSFANDLAKRHISLTTQILNKHQRLKQKALEQIEELLGLLNKFIDGMACLKEVSPRSHDSVMSIGELLSAPIVCAYLSSQNIPSSPVDPKSIIRTNDTHCCAVPNQSTTTSACCKVLSPMIDKGIIPVVGGFVGSTDSGVTTTLGRGGSDLTASLIAGALKADSLVYYKDVDGILTADPRLVAEAQPVSNLSFEEAAELAFLGTQVLHPASIQPAVAGGVKVCVRNSYRPDSPGTTIWSHDHSSSNKGSEEVVRSIAHKRGQVLVNIHSNRMLGTSGFLMKVFAVFDRLQITVDHIATSEVNITVTVDSLEPIDKLRAELARIANVQIEENMGIVSIVGERLKDTPGIASKLFYALENINISLITYGGSGVNLSLVVSDANLSKAVALVHRELFLRV